MYGLDDSHETCFCMSQTSIFSSESFPRYKLIFEGAPNNQQENWTYKVRIIVHWSMKLMQHCVLHKKHNREIKAYRNEMQVLK